MTCPWCGGTNGDGCAYSGKCWWTLTCATRAFLLPPDDGRDHFNTGEDDWDRDADSRAADQELGDE